MSTLSITPTAVVRLSRGTFDPGRITEVEQMMRDTSRYLIPAIKQLDGLIAYYAGASDRELDDQRQHLARPQPRRSDVQPPRDDRARPHRRRSGRGHDHPSHPQPPPLLAHLTRSTHPADPSNVRPATSAGRTHLAMNPHRGRRHTAEAERDARSQASPTCSSSTSGATAKSGTPALTLGTSLLATLESALQRAARWRRFHRDGLRQAAPLHGTGVSSGVGAVKFRGAGFPPVRVRACLPCFHSATGNLELLGCVSQRAANGAHRALRSGVARAPLGDGCASPLPEGRLPSRRRIGEVLSTETRCSSGEERKGRAFWCGSGPRPLREGSCDAVGSCSPIAASRLSVTTGAARREWPRDISRLTVRKPGSRIGGTATRWREQRRGVGRSVVDRRCPR